MPHLETSVQDGTIDSRREKGMEMPHWIERSILVTVT